MKIRMNFVYASMFLWNGLPCSYNSKQAVVRGTTNPAPCCHLANDTDLLTPVGDRIADNNDGS